MTEFPASGSFAELVGFCKTAFAADYARFELELGPQHLNIGGVPHGGLYAALLDTALGSAGCYIGVPDRVRAAVTLSLTVNFLALPQGRRLVAEGRRVGGGRRLYFSEGSVTCDAGVPVARATGSFRYVERAP